MTTIGLASELDAAGIAKVYVDAWRSAYAAILPHRVLLRMSYEDQTRQWAGMIRDRPGAQAVIVASEAHTWSKDAKTELQEWLQARRIAVPSYRIVGTTGQAHAQTFEVECAIPALSLAETGRGRSRRAAEQEAARRLLDALKASDQPGGPLRS